MSRLPRSQVIDESAIGIYHCWNAFVRQLFLAGVDPVTGVDYTARKDWFIDRLRELAHIFTIDIICGSIMSTHYHLILRNRPDVGAAITDKDVVRRWRALYAHFRDAEGRPLELADHQIQLEIGDPDRLVEWRKRLSSISWFLKCFSEVIAKRANEDDQVFGAFFARRFQAKRLADEGAVIACMAYISLNEIHAGLADRPENSRYSTIWHRLQGRQARVVRGIRRLFANIDSAIVDSKVKELVTEALATGDWATLSAAIVESMAMDGATILNDATTMDDATTMHDATAIDGATILSRTTLVDGGATVGGAVMEDGTVILHGGIIDLECAERGDMDDWLCPINEAKSLPCLAPHGRAAEFRSDLPAGYTPRRQGALPMTADEYFALVDWTGRQARAGKTGVIPATLAPILKRLGVRVEMWDEVTTEFDNWFTYVVGRVSSMIQFAARVGLKWVRGIRHSRRTFE